MLVTEPISTEMKLDADPKKPDVVIPLPPPRKPNLPVVPSPDTPVDSWNKPVNAD